MFRQLLRVQLVMLDDNEDSVDTKTFFFNNKVIIIYVINKSRPLQSIR